jgi:hypothetical protein
MAWLLSNDGFGISRRGGSTPGKVPELFTRAQVVTLLKVQTALSRLGAAITDIGEEGVFTMEPTASTEVPPDEASDLALRGISTALHIESGAPIEHPKLKLVAQGGEIVA